MRFAATIAGITGLALAPVAQAANDPGLMLPTAQVSAPRMGAGVQASFAMPLGARGQADGPRLSLRAGPSLTRERSSDRQVRTRVAPLAELALRPGHSTSFSLAGTPVAQSFSLAALHDEQARRERHGGKGVSTLGAVGIGVGVLVVAAGIGLLVLIDKIEDNSD